MPVTETTCLDCGGDLAGEDEEVVTNTEIPPAPSPQVKAYRIHIRSCRRCQRKVRGRHPDVSPDQLGTTAHRLGPRAQAAAMLHYGYGIPQCKVLRVPTSLTGLSVTQGALTQAGCDAPRAMIDAQTSRTQTAAGRTCGGLTIPAGVLALVGNATTDGP